MANVIINLMNVLDWERIMKGINKRFAKLKLISKVTQFDTDGDSTITGKAKNTAKPSVESETTSLTTECTIADKGGEIEIEYSESEITGMDGSVTKIVFDKSNPYLLSILREGSVSTALVFEEGKRHLCVYQTPYFPIELCITTLSLENTLSYEGGRMNAEYLVEMNGILAEKTNITVTVF